MAYSFLAGRCGAPMDMVYRRPMHMDGACFLHSLRMGEFHDFTRYSGRGRLACMACWMPRRE